MDVRARNPMNGILMPVRFRDPNVQENISKVNIGQSIGGLHEVLAESADYLEVPFSEHQLAAMRRTFDPEDHWIIPFRKISKSHVGGIFDAVRNRILDWTLKLEAEGILGEGLTFSKKEQEAAQHVVFNITNSTIDQLNSSGTNLKGKT